MADDMRLEYTVDADYSALNQLGKAASDASNRTVQSLNRMDTAFDKNGNKIGALDASLGRFIDKQGKMREANGAFVSSLKNVDGQTEKTKEKIDSLSDRLVRYGNEKKKAGLESKKLSDAISSAINPMNSLSGGLGVAVNGVTAFSAAIVAGTAALIAFGDAQSQVVVDLDNLSRNSGTAIDTFQVLSSSASKLGIDAQGVADILQDTADRVGEFTRLGEGEFVDLYEQFFKPIGVGVEELRTMKPEEVLRTLYEQMIATGATSNEMKSAFEQLASNSSRLTDVWGMSTSQLSDLKDEMQRQGQLVNEEDVEQARQINDQAKELKRSFEAMKTAILLSLQEPIKGAMRLVDSFIDKITDMIVTTDTEELDDLNEKLKVVDRQIKETGGLGIVGVSASAKRLQLLKEIEEVEKRIADKKEKRQATPAGESPSGSKPVSTSTSSALLDTSEEKELSAYEKKIAEKRLALQKAFANERETIEIAARENETKIRELYKYEADLMDKMLDKNNQDKLSKIAELSKRESDKVASEQLKITQARLKAQRDAERKSEEKQQAVEKTQSFIVSSETDLSKINADEAEKIRIIEDYRKKDLINESLYQEAKSAIQSSAEEKRNDLISSAREKTRELAKGDQDPIQAMYQEQAEKMALIQEFRQQELISEQQFQDAKNAIVKQASEARVQMLRDEQAANFQAASSFSGAISGSFGELASAIGQAKGEQSSAYQAAIAAQKSFALASASLSLGQAIAQSMAEPAKTTSEKFANAATITSALGSVISSISSVSYGGGKAMGGSVQAGKMYEVGERGVEMFQSGGRNFMIPDRAGNVVPNNKIGGSMGNNISVVQNFSVEASATYDSEAMKQLMNATKAQTMQILQQQSLQGGMLKR